MRESSSCLFPSIDYNDYVGRIAIGRIERGVIKQNQDVMVCNYHQDKEPYKSRVQAIYQIDGLNRIPVESAKVGDIVCFSGISDITMEIPLLLPPLRNRCRLSKSASPQLK